MAWGPMDNIFPNDRLTVHKGSDLITKGIVDPDPHMTTLWQVVAYGCSRIERVRVVLVQPVPIWEDQVR